MLQSNDSDTLQNLSRLSLHRREAELNEGLRYLNYRYPLMMNFNTSLAQILLPRPNTTKFSTLASNVQYSACMSSMQGWRMQMEDASCLYLELPHDDTGTTLLGVFDGHGGTYASDFASTNLYKFIMKQSEYRDNFKKAAVNGFVEIDAKMRRERPDDISGTTAITVFIRNNTLYCCNVGDSRAICYENGRVTVLSTDHKPSVSSEYRRIVQAGGWVENDRVNGSLALSRALGDFQFKNSFGIRADQQIVSCYPDIVMKKIDKNWKFVLLACDGIWEVKSNEQVAEFVKYRLNENMPLDKICEALMMDCLAKKCEGTCLGCDNMTVGILVFNWNE